MKAFVSHKTLNKFVRFYPLNLSLSVYFSGPAKDPKRVKENSSTVSRLKLKKKKLRYNSHTIKSTFSVVFSIFMRSYNHHHWIIPEYFHPSKMRPQTPSYSLPISPPSPWQLLIFLSLWTCLFWMFHKNGIIQYVAFLCLDIFI